MTDRDSMSAADYLRLVGPRDPLAGRSRTGTGPAKPKGPTKSWQRFDEYLRLGGFGPVVHEHVFHPRRKWRFDWFLPGQGLGGIAFEYDGLFAGRDRQDGTASHGSVAGILRDSEKLNEAQAMGIQVYRVNAKSIQDGSAFELAARVLTRQEG